MARVRLQAAEWATLIDEWRRSGLSMPAFCQRYGLSRGTMQNWVYKPALRRAVEEVRRKVQAAQSLEGAEFPSSDPAPAFVPIQIADVAPRPTAWERSGVEIILAAGQRLVVAPGFDADTLRRALAVVEGRPC